MDKAKKYSLPYWVKQALRGTSVPERLMADAIREFASNGNDHPGLAFTGTPLELANALYLEWAKRSCPWQGFYPTPLSTAAQVVKALNIQPGQVVLDAGTGFGNLSQAVIDRGGVPIMVEYGMSTYAMAEAVWAGSRYEVVNADFLDGYRPPEFDYIIGNPPFGRVFGESDAALSFMLRYAALSHAGTRLSIILPHRYLDADKPKARVAMREQFDMLGSIDLPSDTFKPLTNISTTLYQLRVLTDGALVNEVRPRVSNATVSQAEAPIVVQGPPEHASKPCPGDHKVEEQADGQVFVSRYGHRDGEEGWSQVICLPDRAAIVPWFVNYGIDPAQVSGVTVDDLASLSTPVQYRVVQEAHDDCVQICELISDIDWSTIKVYESDHRQEAIRWFQQRGICAERVKGISFDEWQKALATDVEHLAAVVNDGGDDDVWSLPDKFAVLVEGEVVLVKFDGRNSIGFARGNFDFEFRGPNISSTGYHHSYANLGETNPYSDPKVAAAALAKELAVAYHADLVKSKRHWPVKYQADVAVLFGQQVQRAKLMSWDRVGQVWYAWLRKSEDAVTLTVEQVLGEWEMYFATHLQPGERVVYRTVKDTLDGEVVRLMPGSAGWVELQRDDGSKCFVTPNQLVGRWDELSPAERGEKFEVPTFGLAANPFDMERAAFNEWVLAVDPAHNAEWSEAYRYFAEHYALSVAGWAYFQHNQHFIDKRRAIDPHLVCNPFVAAEGLFIPWLQSNVDGVMAQSAYLQGYAALKQGSDVALLPEVSAYLASQPFYTEALAARRVLLSSAQPLDPQLEAVGVLTGRKVAQVEEAGYRFVFGAMDDAARQALVGLGAGRGSKLEMLRAKGLTVQTTIEPAGAVVVNPVPQTPSAATVPDPTTSPAAVDTVCRFNTAQAWAAWHAEHRSDIPFFSPPGSLNAPVEVKVGLSTERLRPYLSRGVLVEFTDVRGDPHVGEFEKWQRNGSLLVYQFTDQRVQINSFSVSLDRITMIHLDYVDRSTEAVGSAAQPEPATSVKRPRGLSDDLPLVIEIDVGGRKPVWVTAQIIKVVNQQLVCQRDGGDTLKMPIYARDIAWRVPAVN